MRIPNARYQRCAVTRTNDGNRNRVTSMAGEADQRNVWGTFRPTNARDTLNGLIENVTRGDQRALVSNTSSPTQKYSHTGGQLWNEFDANNDGSVNASLISLAHNATANDNRASQRRSAA